MSDPIISHSDIYHKLGALEGKVDSLIAKTGEYRNDLQDAFRRINQLENRLAWIMGGAVVISSIMPIVMNLILNNLSFKTSNKETDKSSLVRYLR